MADNLRSLMFPNDHCVEEKVDAVLVSLDAKKLSSLLMSILKILPPLN